MPKDDCFVPCTNELLNETEVKGGGVSSRNRGVPVDINVKGRLNRRVTVSTPV
jgi:hypothetical protein